MFIYFLGFHALPIQRQLLLAVALFLLMEGVVVGLETLLQGVLVWLLDPLTYLLVVDKKVFKKQGSK